MSANLHAYTPVSHNFSFRRGLVHRTLDIVANPNYSPAWFAIHINVFDAIRVLFPQLIRLFAFLLPKF